MNARQMQSFLEALYVRRARGIKLGLETMEALLEELGRPQDALAVIHIAGTNGKGSVAAMLDAILRQAGYHTGLYTSPHLVEFNERIRVDSRPVANDALAELLEEVDQAANTVARDPTLRQPTFFEFATAVGLLHFQRAEARLVVLETGLGGRLDATNVVNPLLSVITSIGVDHTAFLGSDPVRIAWEKAGIIKPGRPVVCGVRGEDPRAEIRRVAAARGAPWIDATEIVSVQRVRQDLDRQRIRIETAQGRYPPVPLPLLGAYQLQNAATAVAAAEALADHAGLAVNVDTISAGLAAAEWPGRTQRLCGAPPVVLDAAHNPAGALALRTALRELFRKRPLGLIIGMSHDKDLAEFMHVLAPCARRLWTVPLDNSRSADPSLLARHALAAGQHATPAPLADALAAARAWAAEAQGALCIAGSVYLAGEVLRRRRELQLHDPPA